MSPLPPKPDKPFEDEQQDVESSMNGPGIVEMGESSSDDDQADDYGYELLPQEPGLIGQNHV